VHGDRPVRAEPRGDRLGFVRCEVVGDEVQGPALGLRGHQLIEEGEELGTGVPGDVAGVGDVGCTAALVAGRWARRGGGRQRAPNEVC